MSEGDTAVAAASQEDLASVVAMLDEEFVHSKSRELSFSHRFPGVYCVENADNVYIVKEGETILSTVTLKRREWVDNGHTLQLAMIGGVYTVPHARGRGLASAILRHVLTGLQSDSVDLAVLWTNRPSLYTKVGMCLSDRGLFGTLIRGLPKASTANVSWERLAPPDLGPVERIREQWMPSRVHRRPIDYETIPLPAQRVERFVLHDGSEWAAYAIAGRLENTGYVYEVVGPPSSYPPLWYAIYDAYERVHVNDSLGGQCAEWLDARGAVSWTQQSLSMWRLFSPRVTVDTLGHIHIPFLDRM